MFVGFCFVDESTFISISISESLKYKVSDMNEKKYESWLVSYFSSLLSSSKVTRRRDEDGGKLYKRKDIQEF
jgi:hypothetical protein